MAIRVDGFGYDDHFFGRLAGSLDDGGGAADDIGAAHGDHDGGDAGIAGITKADVAEIDAVQRPQFGGQRVGHLVGIVADDIVDLFVDAHVGVHVDKARRDHAAGCVDDLGIGGNDEISADAYDLTAVDEDSAFGDDAVCNGINGTVDDG